jgi:RHS repeat-associated protein
VKSKQSQRTDQRFYASSYGRFNTADPYRASAGASDPGSWNRYAYVQGDPVNMHDPRGLMMAAPDSGRDHDPYRDPFGGGYPSSPVSGPSELAPSMADGGQDNGGGSGGSAIAVGNLAKDGEEYFQVMAAFNRTLANLDADCEKFLNSGGGDVRNAISDLFAEDMVAVGTAPSAIAAFTGTGGTDIPAGYAAMVFNRSSAFFYGGLASTFTINNGKIKGGTAKAQSFIILHELAHLVSARGFGADYGKPDVGKSNDNLIDTKCKKTLESIR